MAVIKRIKSSQYAQIHNEPLQSLEDIRAIGVLSHLMSLPEDWEIHKTQLYKKFGRAAITHGLKELEEKGYFLSIQYRDGKMNYYMYYISDVPFTNEEVEDILKELGDQCTNLISVSSRFDGILSSVENRQLTTNSSQQTSTKEINTKKYKQRNKDLVNKKQVNNSNLEYDNQSSKVYEIEKQYMKKGLSKEVIQRVKEEVESNRDKIDNYIAYYRSCLDNTLYKSRLRHGQINMPYPHLGEAHPLNYGWLDK
jgi:hypothetical protein